jgi:hypothetical protein
MFTWVYLLLKSTKNPITMIYWFIISLRQIKAEKVAYSKWETMGFLQIENFLINNVPMAKENHN